MNDERTQHHGKSRQQEQTAIGKIFRQREGRRERDDAAHPAPRRHDAALDRGQRHCIARMKQPLGDQCTQGGAIDDDQDDAGEDDGGEDVSCYREVVQAHRFVEPGPDRPQLHADQHERQHIEDEDRGFPHRIGRHPKPRRGPRRCGARDGDGIGNDGQDAGKADALGDDPHRKSACELQDDRARRLIHSP